MGEASTKTFKIAFACLIAVVQIGVALAATVASDADRLSDMACIGGGFGTLVNIVVFGIVVVWIIVLWIKASRSVAAQDTLTSLYIVTCSSALAILFGWDPALSCTV